MWQVEKQNQVSKKGKEKDLGRKEIKTRSMPSPWKFCQFTNNGIEQMSSDLPLFILGTMVSIILATCWIEVNYLKLNIKVYEIWTPQTK
jgi:hypothetical protein